MFHQTKQIKNYLRAVAKGDCNSLIVCSRAGLGKTHTTLTYLKELNYQENKNYIYSTSYITPLELYLLLEQVNNLKAPKILVLDDIEFILSDRKILGLLRSALWQKPDGKRKVCYISGSHRVDSKEINFEGKVVFLINEFKEDNPLLEALRDRGLYLRFDPNKQEVLKALRKMALSPYQDIKQGRRLKIYNHIKDNFSERTSLRTLIKGFELCKSNPSNWKSLLLNLLKNS